MKFVRFVLLLAAGLAPCFGQAHSIVTNLEYRLSWGDLNPVTPGKFQNTRTLRIEEGGQSLLQDCLDQPLKWAEDRMFFRLAHRHAASSTSCRERGSPSMHVVSYPAVNGGVETRVHFDLHGPQNPIAHFGEVVRNRLTFGRTSEFEVYRGLLKLRNDPDKPVPPPAYNFAAHASEYYKATFGLGAISSAFFLGAARSTMSRNSNWGEGRERFANRIEANLARNAIRQTIEFGVGAALQQDLTYATSGEERLGPRLKAALFHSFFVSGRGGSELAFPRIAAAFGTSWTARAWHPWTVDAPGLWTGTAIQLSRYVVASFWREFRPDIKQRLGKGREKWRARRAPPVEAAQNTSVPPRP